MSNFRRACSIGSILSSLDKSETLFTVAGSLGGQKSRWAYPRRLHKHIERAAWSLSRRQMKRYPSCVISYAHCDPVGTV